MNILLVMYIYMYIYVGYVYVRNMYLYFNWTIYIQFLMYRNYIKILETVYC